jgi:poly(3-hydroxybutyrate) depolymerase
LAEHRKQHFLAEQVGHYGIFNGSKWRKRIAPVVEAWMKQHHRADLNVVA